MKKVLLFFVGLFYLSLVLHAQTIAEKPTKGVGTISSPFEISTLAHLKWLSESDSVWNGKYFVQTANIDASETKDWNNKAGFLPIGNINNYFKGNYNGNGWCIKNLTINRPNEDNIGLFGCVVGELYIKNLKTIDCKITGKDYVGVLAGSCSQSNIENVFVSGSVTGGDYIGGLIGAINQNTHSNYCDSYASVSGNNNVGGLIGGIYSMTGFIISPPSTFYFSPATLTNSYSRGDVSGTSNIAGLVGELGNICSIKKCYSTGKVSGITNLFGFIAINKAGNDSVSNCYWDATTSARSSSNGGTSQITSAMKVKNNFIAGKWDFVDETQNGNNDIWNININYNDGYPFISKIAPLLITTNTVSSITYNSATLGVTITNLGFHNPTQCGLVWDTKHNPFITLTSKTNLGPQTERRSYQSTMDGLLSNTVYYVRAYAINATDTVYGNDVVFATPELAPAISYPNQYLHLVTGVKADTITPKNAGGAAQQMIVTTFAQVNKPGGIIFDKHGNLYATDRANHQIFKITPNKTVSTIAGSGTKGYINGNSTAALFNEPSGIAIKADGTLFVVDRYNHVIRRIAIDGSVTTYAGVQSSTGSYADGPLASAKFNEPIGLKFDADYNLIVAEFGGNRIRKISTSGVVSTLAGNGTLGYVNGLSRTAQFRGPAGLTFSQAGDLYVTDYNNYVIRKISADSIVTTFAGSGIASTSDGVGTSASFNCNHDITTDRDGNMYIVDNPKHTVRKISPTANVLTIAGNAGNYGLLDGVGTATKFYYPTCVALDSIENLYVGDGLNNKIRKLTRFSISPSTLPAGLSFNTNTGEITGTPTVASAMTAYTIICANTAGTDTTTLYFATEAPKLAVSTTNNALAFDGISNYVSASGANASIAAAGKMTIEAWVNWQPTLPTDVQFICGSDFERMELHTGGGSGANGLRFIPIKACYYDAKNVLPTNKWTHIAASYDSVTKVALMYINGVEVALTCQSNSPTKTSIGNQNFIGKRNSASYPLYFKGQIDEFRLWKTIRTKNDIIAKMNSSLRTATDLVASYSFNQGKANQLNTGLTSLEDSVNSKNNGTLNNFTLNGTTSNWTSGAPLDYTSKPEAITLAKEANSTAYAEVTTNLAWNVSSDKTWLTLTPDTTKGSGTIKIVASANPTVAERTAIITISATDVSSKTIVVKQAAGDATLWIKDSILNLSVLTDTVVIKSNTSPTISSNLSWISTSIKDTLLIVTASENTASIERKDSFMLSVPGINKKIIVTQAASAIVLSSKTTKLELGAKSPLTTQFTFNTNAKFEIISTSKSLLLSLDNQTFNDTISQDSTDYRTQTIWIKADTNKLAAVQMDSIILVSGNEKMIIRVEQDAPIIAQSVSNANMAIGQAALKYLYTDLFTYLGSKVLKYEIESSNIDILSYAPIYGGFKLVGETAGTAKITVRAKSANDSAKLSFEISLIKDKNCMTIDSAIEHPVCLGDSTGQIIATPRTGATPYYYSWSNYMSNDTIKNLAAGKYKVTITDALGCTIVSSFVVKEGSKIVLKVQPTAPNCGASDGAIQVSASGGYGEYSYAWNNGKTLAAIDGIAKGQYSVRVSDKKACSVQQEIDLNDKDAVKIDSLSVIPSACKQNKGAIYTTIIGAYDAIQWSKETANGNTSLPDSVGKQITSLFPGKYAISVTSGNCVALKKFEVPYTKMKQPQLSLVTIDKAFKYPLIVWLRDADSTAVESYSIFRDGKLISTLPYRSYSLYHDENPTIKIETQAYSYQITANNACGISTPKSNEFKTIFLQVFQSKLNPAWTDLIWDAYQGEASTKRYVIYRLVGNDTLVIDTVSNKSRYTDKKTQSADTRKYFVTLLLDSQIEISQLKTDTGPFSQSFSNMSEASLVSLGENVPYLNGVLLAPNPSNGITTISVATGEALVVELTDLLGHQLATAKGIGATTIDCSTLAKGFYLVNVKTATAATTQRLAVE